MTPEDVACSFCWCCAGGNRPLPEERHGVVAYVHATTEGERLVCAASAVRLMGDENARLRDALVSTVAKVHAEGLDTIRALESEVEALRAQRDEAIRSAVAGWNPERR